MEMRCKQIAMVAQYFGGHPMGLRRRSFNLSSLSLCDERHCSSPKATQDQSGCRETVCGAPRSRPLTRSRPFRHPYVDIRENLRSIARRSWKTKGSSSPLRLMGVNRGMLGTRCECIQSHSNRGARRRFLFNLQANLVRESENMVRDTATRLERAAGELEDLLVCAA